MNDDVRCQYKLKLKGELRKIEQLGLIKKEFYKRRIQLAKKILYTGPNLKYSELKAYYEQFRANQCNNEDGIETCK